MELIKIVIADDDPRILKGLKNFLTRNGYHVFTAANGCEVLNLVKTIKPDILLLDIMMPQMDGLETCRKIRERSDVPIIFISAKTDITDKILGLALGSDDYITKPFDNDELLYRIKAVLRRTTNHHNTNAHLVKLPDIEINKESRTVEIKGKRIELTPKEFDFLWLLASQPERVWTKEQLLFNIWETEFYEDTSVVTSLVRRLRDKIESDPVNPSFIKTVRGVGYRFSVESAE